MRTGGFPICRTAAAVLLAALRCLAAPDACSQPLAHYDGWNVLSVSVTNPLGFIAPWASGSGALRNALELNAGQPFSRDKLNRDNVFLNAHLRNAFASNPAKLKVSAAAGAVLACDEEAKTLKVLFVFFTSALSPFLPPTLEEKNHETAEPATTAAARASSEAFLADPAGGYNGALHAFGGMNFSYRSPYLTAKGDSEISGGGHSGHLELGGFLGPSRFWNRADYAATFDYTDLPAGDARYAEGKLTARFVASTAEMSDSRLLFRYGASLEGGHQQSLVSPPAESLPNTGYGAFKTYWGVTGRPAAGAFAASYGLQVGSTLTAGLPVFTKHLVDLGYTTTLPLHADAARKDSRQFTGPLTPGVHRSLGIETRAAAGFIRNAAGAPLSERFLGGDEVHPFVQDSSWTIESDPLIRSIPENELGASTRAGAPGGTRFYSANATVSWTLWGQPMLPRELASSPGSSDRFLDALNAGFNTAAIAMADSARSKDPAFSRRFAELTPAIAAKASELRAPLSGLSQKIADIPANIAATPDVKAILRDIKSNLVSTRGAVILTAAAPSPKVLGQLTATLIPTLSDLVRSLTKVPAVAARTQFVADMETLMGNIDATSADISRMLDQLPFQAYVDRAWTALGPSHNAIDVFLHRLNIYSIAPVAIFDVARVWPVGEGVRYGVGGGLRFSLVNVNFTAGYAANPQRTRAESAGALFFRIDVASMF